ncbi:MAG: DUF2169 domain-containing protein [Myxococcales bacterium]|nr:DUF2169 domain-containing protein [Myxococcales bacterium]
MKLVNYTPWPHLLFERRDTFDRPLGVLALQGTFAIDESAPLRALREQAPVQVGDVHRGDPATSSLKRAGATATFKPKSEIHVDAVAHAPTGKPRTSWPIRIRVGKLQQDLVVRGPHQWRHAPVLGWRKGAIEPCTEVPLHDELAFGGSHRIDGKLVEERRNPVGTGFLPRGIDTRDPIAAPQIVAVDEPLHLPGSRVAPRGCGPIPSYFAPRCDRIGTIDARWLAEKWPCVPEDFDYAHYQAAHPDLVYPGYLEGDEPIELVHLLPGGGSVLSALPDWRVWTLLRLGDGRMLRWPTQLDTVHFDLASPDPSEHRAYLTWRAVFPLSASLRRVESRMTRSDQRSRVEAA